jgi:uncharacterized membrane protein YdjX (TVP38/TMEM64 family)
VTPGKQALIRWIWITLVIAGSIAAVRLLPVLDWIIAAQNAMAEMGIQGALLFPLLVAVCNVLLLPGGILCVSAGFFFGLWWGTLIVLVGHVLGAAAAFGISRGIGHKWLRKKLLSNPRWAALDKGLAEEGWKVIVLSQLNPLFPTSLINYLYGLTRMRLSSCLFWVAVGQAPSRFLYAYLGTLGQHGVNVLRGGHQPSQWEYALWIGGLVVAAASTAALGRIALRLLKDTSAAMPGSETPPGHPNASSPVPGNEDPGSPILRDRHADI